MPLRTGYIYNKINIKLDYELVATVPIPQLWGGFGDWHPNPKHEKQLCRLYKFLV